MFPRCRQKKGTHQTFGMRAWERPFDVQTLDPSNAADVCCPGVVAAKGKSTATAKGPAGSEWAAPRPRPNDTCFHSPPSHLTRALIHHRPPAAPADAVLCTSHELLQHAAKDHTRLCMAVAFRSIEIRGASRHFRRAPMLQASTSYLKVHMP